MKLKCSLLSLVPGLLSFPFQPLSAQQPVTFEIVATFNCPGATDTVPNGINIAGDVAGSCSGSAAGDGGFVRYHNGRFSPLISDPNSDEGRSVLTGINSSRVCCGWYSEASNAHGFLVSASGQFTEFNIEGATDTTVDGINDAGNLCGNSTDLVHGTTAWAKIDGTVFSWSIPTARFNYGLAINNLNQTVGAYTTRSGDDEGFFRDTDGTLIYPIRVPGMTSVDLVGINDYGQMTGDAVDDSGKFHGVFFSSLNKSVLYDYPGAVNTFFGGINNHGLITGDYFDAAGNIHGFLLRVVRTAKD